MAGVTNDVPAGCRMIGIPATPERDQKMKQAAFSKLPDMRRQVKQLQRTLQAILDESPATARIALKAAESAAKGTVDGRRAVA
jgi:UDP-3-O-[3-hydroxymyristoyl] glucosamine N-acyltransferase